MSNKEMKKVTNEIKKGSKSTKDALKTAAKAAGDTAVVVANVAGKKISEGRNEAEKKLSHAVHEYKLNKYKPLFPDEYQSPDFDRPKLVVIKDEDNRKGIEVCDGAIGWINTKKIPEILFIYEEFVQKSGLKFYPRAICDAAYFKHPFEDDLYLQVKDYIKICRDNQLTELKNIAYYLGASKCRVEVYEEKNIFAQLSGEGHRDGYIKEGKQKLSQNKKANIDSHFTRNTYSKIIMKETFKYCNEAKKPKLQWFANDKEILSLIEKRCSNDCKSIMKEYNFDVTSSASTSISANLAVGIDVSLKNAGIDSGIELSAELKKENKKQFIYNIVF